MRRKMNSLLRPWMRANQITGLRIQREGDIARVLAHLKMLFKFQELYTKGTLLRKNKKTTELQIKMILMIIPPYIASVGYVPDG